MRAFVYIVAVAAAAVYVCSNIHILFLFIYHLGKCDGIRIAPNTHTHMPEVEKCWRISRHNARTKRLDILFLFNSTAFKQPYSVLYP